MGSSDLSPGGATKAFDERILVHQIFLDFCAHVEYWTITTVEKQSKCDVIQLDIYIAPFKSSTRTIIGYN